MKARDERGAITIEYILIIALIAIIFITLFTVLLWPALKPALETLVSLSGDGGNPSPLGEERFVEVPSGDETPPTEVGGLRMKRAHEVGFQSTRPRNPPA